MYLKNTSFLVLGMQKSGICATNFLLSNGAKVFVYDDGVSESVKKNIKEAESLGAKICSEPFMQVEYVDVLVLSPAVPVDHKVAVRARELNKRIIGEFELASNFTTNLVVAVTGTNGKTTTCSLIDYVLNKAEMSSLLVGNVGIPFTSKIADAKSDDIFVAEVSSFQLETVNRFCPHIACILNITPDHLNRHYNMENYVYLKSKLILNLRESEFAVLNFDDELVKQLSKKTRAKVVWFSLKEKVDGAYLEDEFIYYKGEIIASVKDIQISGEHNVENVLASVCVLKLLGLSNSEILEGIKTFSGVKHRVQKVRTLNGITYYNDSKSTNANSCKRAVESVKEPTILIMGGYDKGLNYEDLMLTIKGNENIKKIILTGQSSKNMYAYAVNCGIDEISVVKDFSLAVHLASSMAKSGYSVLLSPATSSFDEFGSFEERGDKFIEIVEKLQ
ncbi:MAG: UDP-N-acetylmuramoyl-L-alanine--D-glutamate ligase [Clostridia bacterium]|nr:UDP-N-acetylmuramoyl-L-alanine--D-glutamate ligase [Clostridia bacterium]